MIGRKSRFHGLNALRFVYKQGRTARTEHCSLRYVQNPRRNNLRLAVVASKKLSKSAVVRNRVRRRIYEAARLQINQALPYDLVFTAYSDRLANMPARELNDIVSKLLQISGISSAGDRAVVDKSENTVKNI